MSGNYRSKHELIHRLNAGKNKQRESLVRKLATQLANLGDELAVDFESDSAPMKLVNEAMQTTLELTNTFGLGGLPDE